MNLYDEDEAQKKKVKMSSSKKIIIILIIFLVILIGIITTLIAYIKNNPVKITAYIDGVQRNDFVSLLDFQTDENGNTEIYIPINDAAPYFGYIGYKGEYKRASEDNSKCYVINETYEVAMYTLKSNVIYKLNLQNTNSEYDYCNIDKAVFESNGKLYTTVEGAEEGFNITLNYDEKSKTITIYTLPYLAEIYGADLKEKTIGSYGTMEVENSLTNWKAIFDGMLVVKSQGQKYGVISTEDYSIILEPKYDSIEYIQYSSDFIIQTNGQIGLLTKDGKTKINALYDELTLMDRNTKLYKIKKGNGYGVINESEDTVIYPEYQAIGIDIGDFAANGIKSGYIILDKLIPVMMDNQWAFFNLQGKMITSDFIYEDIGCKAGNGNNVYSLLTIPEYNLIIVQKDRKYGFMNIEGNDRVLPYGFVFDEIFMRVSNGKSSYLMTYNKKEWSVEEYLQKQGLRPKEEEK